MSDPRLPTIDQLQVFLTVADCGSFASAARRLGRATSVVSYQVANLEAQLGLTLFDRHGTRKPRLSEAGRAVLADARTVARGLDGLLARARVLLAGLEAEVSLVVDVMLPTPLLVEVLEAFRAAFPFVSLRLQVEALGAVAQMVRDGVAKLGVSGPLPRTGHGLESTQLGAIRLLPVASPAHALSRTRGRLTAAHARDHVQLVLTDRSQLTEGQDFQVLATQTWRLGDLGAKHALLLAGLGWGSMPELLVRDDLAAGRLVRLPIDTWDNILLLLQIVWRGDAPPGPAGRWLIERFSQAGRAVVPASGLASSAMPAAAAKSPDKMRRSAG
jgi:DNA-binding transcriptional LysR family regulator